jgi:hypothetical protein
MRAAPEQCFMSESLDPYHTTTFSDLVVRCQCQSRQALRVNSHRIWCCANLRYVCPAVDQFIMKQASHFRLFFLMAAASMETLLSSKQNRLRPRPVESFRLLFVSCSAVSSVLLLRTWLWLRLRMILLLRTILLLLRVVLLPLLLLNLSLLLHLLTL